jgi:hypothetical protein
MGIVMTHLTRFKGEADFYKGKIFRRNNLNDGNNLSNLVVVFDKAAMLPDGVAFCFAAAIPKDLEIHRYVGERVAAKVDWLNRAASRTVVAAELKWC